MAPRALKEVGLLELYETIERPLVPVLAEMERDGAWVFHAGLTSASSATVVRATGGEVSMTDGPYAETKEQMAGFWVIEAADLDAALELARRGSAACAGKVEVRPFESA